MALGRPLAAIGIVFFLAGCSDSSSSSPEENLNPDPIVPSSGVEIVPLTLDFGDVLMETSRSLEVSIHNTCSSQLEVTDIGLQAASSQDFQISSGPESVSLAPDATVKVQVTFAPTSLAPQAATLEVSTESLEPQAAATGVLAEGSGKEKKNVPVRGRGVPKPVPEIEVAPLALDFGEVLVGNSKPMEITVRNVGTAGLSIVGAGLEAGSHAAFELSPAGWSGTVAPGASQVFQVTFWPEARGPCEGALAIQSSDADEQLVTVTLAGTGMEVLSPEIEVTPLLLDFGQVMVGSSRSLSSTVRNAGTATLDVSRVALGPGTTTEFSLGSGTSSAAVAPGASIAFEVVYSPVDLSSDSLTVRVESNDADEPSVTVSLAGSGVPVPAPEIEVLPLSLSFGDVTVGTYRDLTALVRNVGTATLDVTSVALAAGTGSEFAIVSGPASTRLAPSASASVTVRYAPVALSSSSSSLRITSNDLDEVVVVVSLAGRGIAAPAPEIEVTPLSLAFGDVVVGSSRTLSFTVRNTGTAALQISSIALGAGTGTQFAIVSGPAITQLSPGASATVSVSYSPVTTASSAGTAVVQSSDADEAAVTVSLTGRGLPAPAPEVEVSPISLSFGEVLVGSSSSLAVAVRNLGTASLSVSSIGLEAGTSAAFSISGAPSSVSLAPGQSISVTVVYAPASEGIDQGRVLVRSSDADEPSVGVSLTGSARAPDPVLRSVTLAWDPPTTNADGTPLSDLAGYKLYRGTASRQYSIVLDVGTATAFTVDSLPAGTFYFAVTAYDTAGNESTHSLEVWTTLE